MFPRINFDPQGREKMRVTAPFHRWRWSGSPPLFFCLRQRWAAAGAPLTGALGRSKNNNGGLSVCSGCGRGGAARLPLSRLAHYLRLHPAGSPMQVVKPSVSREAFVQGTALTIFVEPSGPRTARPVLVDSSGIGPV
jgi:hypothetical protein